MKSPCARLFALAVTASIACGGGGVGPDAAPGDGRAPDAMPRLDADLVHVPRVEPAACRFAVDGSLGLTEGAGYECGDLVVYEDRDTAARTIRVHYIRVAAGAPSPRATIYLDGGPGGNGQGILDYAAYLGPPFLAGLLTDGDFLVLAQRGTSLSWPSLDDPSGNPDLPAYNTAAGADDVNELRAALGYEQLDLYGISYGSRLGLEVLRRHGDHVRAALIEGVVPAQVNWSAAVPASFYGALTALEASCADDAACAGAFGGLEAAFVDGVYSLADAPLTFDYQGEPVLLDGGTYASLLFQLLYSRSTYPWLPLMITDLAARRTDRVGDFVGYVLEAYGGDPGISWNLYYQVVCGELFDPPDEGAFDAANAAVPADIRDLFSGGWYGMLETCASWPAGPPRPELSQPVTSGVRTLLSSGRLDPITPPGFAETAAATLSDSVTIVFEGSGHGATLQSECGQQALFSFLADPAAPPDSVCAAAIATDYVLPGDLAAARPLPTDRIRLELRHAPRLPPPWRIRSR